jgi:hypothetical protein
MKEANRLADALNNGDTYDCGTMVVYGWPVLSSGPDPTSEAAELLIKMADEIERLRAKMDL